LDDYRRSNVTQTADFRPRTDLTTDLAPDVLAELRWRGMLADATPGLAERLARGPIALYNGFDPTGSSMHVGHLVPVFGLLHFQRHGHRPVGVVGGGTGMIGDPSGRSAERNLLDESTLSRNVAGLAEQLGRFLDFAPGPSAAKLVNNLDWLGRFGLIEFLRDVGKHFPVPYMLAKDSVQLRLDSGLSFTEFSYMLLQSADFLHLFREDGVELQTGGADQWGNMTAGLELIRRVDGKEAFALSYPLLTDATGAKFGKTAANTRVWLDPERTTPYEFYQSWIDRPDDEVGKLLRIFTLFDQASVERLEAEQAATPEQRPAQKALAWDITARVHGAAAAEAARRTSEIRFSGDMPTPDQLRTMPKDKGLEAWPRNAVELAVASTAASSNSAARRLIEQRGFRVNDVLVSDPLGDVPDPIEGAWFIRAGKRRLVIGVPDDHS
jgi:tyrosyl-tRNA synthetase